jgi:hypothetical protein
MTTVTLTDMPGEDEYEELFTDVKLSDLDADIKHINDILKDPKVFLRSLDMLKTTHNGMARKLVAANRVVMLLMSESSKYVFLGPPPGHKDHARIYNKSAGTANNQNKLITKLGTLCGSVCELWSLVTNQIPNCGLLEETALGHYGVIDVAEAVLAPLELSRESIIDIRKHLLKADFFIPFGGEYHTTDKAVIEHYISQLTSVEKICDSFYRKLRLPNGTLAMDLQTNPDFGHSVSEKKTDDRFSKTGKLSDLEGAIAENNGSGNVTKYCETLKSMQKQCTKEGWANNTAPTVAAVGGGGTVRCYSCGDGGHKTGDRECRLFDSSYSHGSSTKSLPYSKGKGHSGSKGKGKGEGKGNGKGKGKGRGKGSDSRGHKRGRGNGDDSRECWKSLTCK